MSCELPSSPAHQVAQSARGAPCPARCLSGRLAFSPYRWLNELTASPVFPSLTLGLFQVFPSEKRPFILLSFCNNLQREGKKFLSEAKMKPVPPTVPPHWVSCPQGQGETLAGASQQGFAP